MSEKFSWETPEGKKVVPKEDVVEALKNTDIENPDTQQLMLWWAESKEAEVDKYEDEKDRFPAKIAFEVERAELFLAAGYGQKSWDAFQVALGAATFGKRPDLAEKIQARIDEIDNS